MISFALHICKEVQSKKEEKKEGALSHTFAGQFHRSGGCLIDTSKVKAWFKLIATSQVELSHLLFSEAHRPCLKAFRGKIRGFLISIWETYVCPSP